MPKTWLITGAAGFVGGNLTEFILSKGESVIGLDNFSTGKRSNIERLAGLGGKNFRLIEGDIRDRAVLGKNLPGVDLVVHLAAQVSVQKSISDPEETRSNNVDGFVNILEAAGEAGCETFIYASSCAIYGDNDNLPLSEEDQPMPLSPYAESKLRNEGDAEGRVAVFPDMTIAGLRFFNIFGPWQDFTSGYAAVIPKWIDLCLRGERPVCYGDGGATRDFCYVDNISNAIWTLASGSRPGSGSVFNLGTGKRTSLTELFRIIRQCLVERNVSGLAGELLFEPWPEGDILHSYSDISKIKEEFGVEASISLGEGIEKLISIEHGL